MSTAKRLPKLPAPGNLGTRVARPPMPLFRGTLTLCPHWDPMPGEPMPATIEIIVLAEALLPDEETATVPDLPELKQAGWIGTSHGVLNIYTRTIS